MLISILIAILGLWAVLGMAWIHEYGHLLAGRIAGIPSSRIKVRAYPGAPHIALHDVDGWVLSNDRERFARACASLLHLKKNRALFLAGGLLAQTVVYLVLVPLFIIAHVPVIWALPITVLLAAIPLIHLAIDFVLTRNRKEPHGDFTRLWVVSPPACVGVSALVVVTHLGLLGLLLAHE